MGNSGEMPKTSTSLDDALDAVLGPASQRYFGSAYRDVSYDIAKGEQGTHMEAVGIARYPEAWSVDGDGHNRTPHLSSVDAIVLPLLSLERDASSSEALQNQYVSSIALRAGSAPWERLSAIPMRLHHATRPDGTEVSGTVGNIRVELHTSRSGPAALPAAGRASVYGGLFQETRCHTRDLTRKGQRVLTCRHEAEFSSASPATGLEASTWPSLTVLDYLVTLGQVTQALVYAAAGVSRATAGPLWMRTMRVERSGPPNRANEGDFVSRAEIISDRLLERGGRRVHNVEVVAHTTSGVQATSRLAYTERER